jgi:hypothetical protein
MARLFFDTGGWAMKKRRRGGREERNEGRKRKGK